MKKFFLKPERNPLPTFQDSGNFSMHYLTKWSAEVAELVDALL